MMMHEVNLRNFYAPLTYLVENKDFLVSREIGCPLYIVTGANFTPYDSARHGTESTHAFFPTHSQDHGLYLMNNGAATAVKLLESGHNVLIHGRDSLALKTALNGHISHSNVAIIGGDLADDQDAARLFAAVADFARNRKTSEVRILAYQSFAQSSGKPFKPMAEEQACEVERAASRRIRFVYNMAALGYWLLCEENQPSLRVVALSALAANRPSYGLMADTADKVMNEACWRTFHIESNHLANKPVSVTQINPGITTACDVYKGEEMRNFIAREARADGFPLDTSIESGRCPLPQLSAHDVGEVAFRLLTAEEGADVNEDLPESVQAALYGGYSPQELRAIFEKAVRMGREGDMGLGVDKPGPEHLYAAYTLYGRLPSPSACGYSRISLTPPGQTF